MNVFAQLATMSNASPGRAALQDGAVSGEGDLERGTMIRIHLKEENLEYVQEARLKGLVQKYSEFINFPIYLLTSKEVEAQAGAPYVVSCAGAYVRDPTASALMHCRLSITQMRLRVGCRMHLRSCSGGFWPSCKLLTALG